MINPVRLNFYILNIKEKIVINIKSRRLRGDARTPDAPMPLNLRETMKSDLSNFFIVQGSGDPINVT